VWDRPVEGDYWQEANGGQRKQEGFASNIMHRTDFIEGQRSVEAERMACLWTHKYINKSVFRSQIKTAVQPLAVTQTFCCKITVSPACNEHFWVH
jgi:hypothetical protein